MPLCSFSENYLMLGVTPVENLFIQEYLPRASGDYVRVYLYGLMQCYHPGSDMTLERTARILDLSVDTVRDAFQYWERQGLVRRVSDNPVAYQYLNVASSLLNETPMEQDIYRHRDFNNRLQQIFGSRLLHSGEFNMACEWVEDLHLPEEVVLIMVQSYVASHGAKCQFKSLNKVAMKWAEEEIFTIEQAEEKALCESDAWKTCEQVFRQLSIARKPTKAELDMARKWLEEWKLSPKAIIAACRETVNARNPNMGYLDGILKRHTGITSGSEMTESLEQQNKLFESVKALHEALGIGFNQPTPDELRTYRNYLEAGFAPETILRVARELKETMKSPDMQWLNEALIKLMEREQITLEAVEAHFAQQKLLREQIAEIYSACNLVKKITATDVAQLEDWLKIASSEVILYAAECARGKALPTGYITKLLTEWKKLDLTTAELVERHMETGRPAAAPKADAKSPQSTPNALNFQQRAYQEGELDYLFDKMNKYDDEEENHDAQ